MILCFSGTGNSRYVAEFIADKLGDTVVDLNEKIKNGDEEFPATVCGNNGKKRAIKLKLGALTPSERDIILKGCLINYYKK